MRPYMLSQVRSQSDTRLRTADVKTLFPACRQRAFPFGDTIGSVAYSELTRLSQIPSRTTVETLVDAYLATFNMVFPLVDASAFREELDNFFEHPNEVTNSWLAQLYMVMALGCYTNPQCPAEEVPNGTTRLADRLVDGAEAAFAHESFLIKPTLASFTVLCMLVIAKQMDIVTHHDADSCWQYMGIVVRQAMFMWLHRDPDVFEGMPKTEAAARKRIWATVALLDLHLSVGDGRQSQCGPDDFEHIVPSVPSNGGDENVFYYQSTLLRLMPTLCGIVNKLNSLSPDLDYEQVVEIDTELRGLLRSVESLAANASSNRLAWMHLQEMMLGNLIRRVRLAVHQPWAKEARQDPKYQASHWTVLECCLGILRYHQYLFDDPRLRWVSLLFNVDFRLSVISICLGLREKRFADTPEPGTEKSAKELAWESLRGAQEILKYNLSQSIDSLKMFVGVSNMMAMLEALEAGTPFDSMQVFKKATTEALDIVEERMKAMPQADTPVEPSDYTAESMEWSSSGSGLDGSGLDGYGGPPWLMGGIIDPALSSFGDPSGDLVVSSFQQKLRTYC